MVNVLITAASRRVALVKDFINVSKKVIAVDCDRYAPALHFADKFHTVPMINGTSYFEAIEEIIKKEKINLVIPTIDLELLLWAERKEYFKKKGVHVSISPPGTIRICNNKWKTFLFFKKHNFPFPETYLPNTLKNGIPYPDSFRKEFKVDIGEYEIKFPLFIKPRSGRGSVDTHIIRDYKELMFYRSQVPDPVIQENLDGKEFTVDAFYSREGKLIHCVPRYRLVVRAGVSDRGKTFKNETLAKWVEEIGNLMKFEGAVNLQGKIDNGKITFFEINPRFSGGIQLCTAAINESFAKLLIKEMSGEALESHLGEYANGLIMTSYEDSLYLDSRHNLVEKNCKPCY